MGLAVIFLFLGFLNSFSLVSLRKQKLILISTIAAFLLNFAFDLLLIPRYGYIGASIASGIGYFAFFAFSFYFVRKLVGGMNLSHTIIRPFLGVISMSAFLMYFRSASLFIVIPLGITVYALGLIASGVFLDEDVKLMKSIIFR
jgi:O-antigen/teichoic acid export membrane protein